MTERETRTALPSTPVAAHRSWVKQAPRRSRLELVIWGTAILFGSTIGGTLALRAEPASSQPAAVQPANGAARSVMNPASGGAAVSANPAGSAATATTSPVSGGAVVAANSAGGPATTTANPSAAAATTSPSAGATATTAASVARAAAIDSIHDALRRFVSWSRGHAGARCPDAAALGAQPDPWGHALRITCTDQPADQIAGALSAGPDGVAGTRDDIESWTLGDAVTDQVHGPRWRASRTGTRRTAGGAVPATAPPPPATTAPPAVTAHPTKPPASPGAGSSDNDGDGIPDRR